MQHYEIVFSITNQRNLVLSTQTQAFIVKETSEGLTLRANDEETKNYLNNLFQPFFGKKAQMTVKRDNDARVRMSGWIMETANDLPIISFKQPEEILSLPPQSVEEVTKSLETPTIEAQEVQPSIIEALLAKMDAQAGKSELVDEVKAAPEEVPTKAEPELIVQPIEEPQAKITIEEPAPEPEVKSQPAKTEPKAKKDKPAKAE